MAAQARNQTKTTQSSSGSGEFALTARTARPSLMARTASGALGSHVHPASQGTTRSAMNSHDSGATIKIAAGFPSAVPHLRGTATDPRLNRREAMQVIPDVRSSCHPLSIDSATSAGYMSCARCRYR
jgi:hypothetical protein